MKITANGIEIEVDVQGPPGGQPLLLVMGLGMQYVAWPEELVADLVSRGFRVVRFDNRDIGLSQGFDQLGPPRMVGAMLRYTLRLPVPAPYQLRDMADDAIGVLDALGIRSAHVVGASMGGMIAQHMAARHPTRVRSLTLIMTTSGARHLPQPALRTRQALMSRPRSAAVADVVAHLEALLRVIGSPGYPADPARQRERLEAAVRRAWRPAGTARQLIAIAADGDRSPMLSKIRAPTRVVHGADDPLVPPAAAPDLAAKIAGATLDLVPGMGHDLPLALLPRLADDIAQVAGSADQPN
ncbi:MAG: alpha/beta fold hydrolase [Burkholderiaceae bacterium]|nr:alpha/beta fold hydrolase [Burkholderiaceae bacterium]